MKIKIKLNRAEDVSEFVTLARKCDFDIDVQYRHILLDGKSFLGMMSLDLTNDLTIYYDGVNPVFESMLEKFKAEDRKHEQWQES